MTKIMSKLNGKLYVITGKIEDAKNGKCDV
jgi:hypothetical protein